MGGLFLAGVSLVAALLYGLAAISFASGTAPVGSADAALARLIDGNKRFVTGSPNRVSLSAQQWTELAKGQHPQAIILACAD